jgi:hypothetical protein
MAMKKTAKTEEFVIPAPNFRQMKVRITGTAPLIFHKWDEKAIKMILDKQMKKASKGREVRDPEAEYINSFYYDANDNVALPARNLKQAIVGSARFLTGLPMTILRGTIFTKGDKDDFIPIQVNGKLVSKKMVVQRKDEWMRQDMVTVGMGSADVRFRGQLPEWTMDVLIEYDADQLSAEQVLNLMQRAGFSQGLGEWRPEKNGANGTFTVESGK